MNPKHKPRPITSFIEDEFELDSSPKHTHSQETAPPETESQPESESFTILLIRAVMMIIAFAIAISLVILIDNFISQQQSRRISPAHRVSSVSHHIPEPPALYKQAGS